MTTSSRRSRPRVRGEKQARTRPRLTEPLRWTRIRAARARIAAGYYDRDEVQASLVEEVLQRLER